MYPKDTPLALFTSLLPEDLANVPDQSGLRQRILNAVEMARQWINQSEVKNNRFHREHAFIDLSDDSCFVVVHIPSTSCHSLCFFFGLSINKRVSSRCYIPRIFLLSDGACHASIGSFFMRSLTGWIRILPTAAGCIHSFLSWRVGRTVDKIHLKDLVRPNKIWKCHEKEI